MLTTKNASKATTPGGATSPSRSRSNLDTLMRQQLRVADPNDPKMVADALLQRFGELPRARAIAGEAIGVPFAPVAPVTSCGASVTATDLDLRLALEHVETDLSAVLGMSVLKGVQAELSGWAEGIRATIRVGQDAVAMGIDSAQRDRTLAVRRTLGDYARLARMLSAGIPDARGQLRGLARSVDAVSATLLVALGESMATGGASDGRFLLSVSFSEMQIRREAALSALRNLLGGVDRNPDHEHWPHGMCAYRRLFRRLERDGQGELRPLLTMAGLAQVLDDLVARADSGAADGLRALSATAAIDLGRVHRLIGLVDELGDIDAPALASFVESLRLFVDGFEHVDGRCLLRIARPLVLHYGLYESKASDTADQHVVDMVMLRGRLASHIDCMIREPAMGIKAVRSAVMLDKLTYDLDRLIDAHVGSGQGATRVAARLAVLARLHQQLGKPPPIKLPVGIEDLFKSVTKGLVQVDEAMIRAEAWQQYRAEQRISSIALRMAPDCLEVQEQFGEKGLVKARIAAVLIELGEDPDTVVQDARAFPPHADRSIARIADHFVP